MILLVYTVVMGTGRMVEKGHTIQYSITLKDVYKIEEDICKHKDVREATLRTWQWLLEE